MVNPISMIFVNTKKSALMLREKLKELHIKAKIYTDDMDNA
jgi:superfamily II DNA helicase RecQ